MADLKPDFDNPKSPVVASEFVGTSITSQAMPQKSVDAVLVENPHFTYGRSGRRGDVRAAIASGRFSAEMIGLETVKRPDSEAGVLARSVVESGNPGARRA